MILIGTSVAVDEDMLKVVELGINRSQSVWYGLQVYQQKRHVANMKAKISLLNISFLLGNDLATHYYVSGIATS